jgi:hypothetical protein
MMRSPSWLKLLPKARHQPSRSEARGASDRVVVKLDGTYDITRPAFVQFLKDTYAALPHAGPAGEPGAD